MLGKFRDGGVGCLVECVDAIEAPGRCCCKVDRVDEGRDSGLGYVCENGFPGLQTPENLSLNARVLCASYVTFYPIVI